MKRIMETLQMAGDCMSVVAAQHDPLNKGQRETLRKAITDVRSACVQMRILTIKDYRRRHPDVGYHDACEALGLEPSAPRQPV